MKEKKGSSRFIVQLCDESWVLILLLWLLSAVANYDPPRWWGKMIRCARLSAPVLLFTGKFSMMIT